MEKRNVILEIDIPFSVESYDYLPRETIPGWNSKRMERYVEALQAEIEANSEDFTDCTITAIRFAGGTASNAGAGIAALMRSIRDGYRLDPQVSISLQSAISNISGATMPLFKRAGVQRFDFEMMSLDILYYAKLNKVDNLNDYAIICDHFLRSYENDSLGVILAYGYAFDSEQKATESFRRSVLAVARSHASHLILVRAFENETDLDPIAAAHLSQAQEILTEAGFVEYLPLHFARPGAEDPFFVADDQGSERLAFGLGAETRMDGAISKNTSDLDLYLRHSDDFQAITQSVSPFE